MTSNFGEQCKEILEVIQELNTWIIQFFDISTFTCEYLKRRPKQWTLTLGNNVKQNPSMP